MPTQPDFRWSTLADCRAAGLDDLIAAHWEEIEDHRDVSPVAVDWPRYIALERLGQLKMASLWAGGQMVGYASFFVCPPMHSRGTIWAVCDAIYLDPGHRRGWAGVKLIKDAEHGLRAMGARIIMFSVKDDDLAGKRQRGTAGRLLARLGYSPFDRSWSKVL